MEMKRYVFSMRDLSRTIIFPLFKGRIERIIILFFTMLMLAGCVAPAMVKTPKPLVPAAQLPLGVEHETVVLARAFWQDSGVVVEKGASYDIRAEGRWSIGPICGWTDASGEGVGALCAGGSVLIGKISKHGESFTVGKHLTLIPEQEGILYLRAADDDSWVFVNSGSMRVRIGKEFLASQAAVAPFPPGVSPAQISVATGIYSLDQSTTFNVLDKVVFDAEHDQITLIGHYDRKFEGPRIPYLQHLSTLLEYPEPEFSLNWTKDSEAKVDALFRRMDSMYEMRRVAKKWGEVIGPDGRPTTQGRVMLPLFGVKPTENGKGPGYLGVTTHLNANNELIVSSVEPDSPAGLAGLRAGDNIFIINYKQPHHPSELRRIVRKAGAGANINIDIYRNRKYMSLKAKLGTGKGDPWNDLNRFEMIAAIFWGADMKAASNVINNLGKFTRLKDTKVAHLALQDLIYATNNWDNWTALKNKNQRGEITWEQVLAGLMRYLLQGIDRAFELYTLTDKYDNARRRGYGAEEAFNIAYMSLDQEIKPVLMKAMQKLLRKHDEIVMPVSMVESTLGARPMVVPEYISLDKHSQLARVMLEADYLGKSLINMPELKDRVRGYQTQYAYYRNNPRETSAFGNESTHRMWISIDSLDIAQSVEGSTLEIRDIKMRFNIRSGASASAKRGGYEALLTSLYDDLAEEFHVLHELREAAKLSAVSRWIKTKKPDFTLPAKGRVRWQGPGSLPGVVNLIWSPNSVKVEMNAMGGISYVPPIGPARPIGPGVPMPVVRDSSVVDLRDSKLTVVPQGFDNQTLRRILSKKTVVPPPPVPRPVGGVVRATKGERTLKALTVKNPENLARCNAGQSLELHQKLETARKAATQLKVVEDSINYITAQSPGRQKEFTSIEKELKQARDEFMETAADILTQGVSDTYDVLRSEINIKDFETMNQGIEVMRDAESFVGNMKGKIDKMDLAYRTVTADDIESRNRAVKDLVNFTKDLVSEADFKGNDPTSRAFRTASKTFGRVAKYKDAITIGQDLITLGEGLIRVKAADQLTEQELANLTKKLLPMQRRLSDKLDKAIKDPAVQDWLSNKSKVDCK